MALYFYFNETTGDLVYSDQATYDVEGYTALGEQTDMDPAASIMWVFNSKRSGIKTVAKDPAVTGKIAGLIRMNGMFSNCPSLISLDLSGFDISQVTDMDSIFNGCSSLTNLDLSGFDTSQVTKMNYMFQNCSSLVSLDLSSFDTSQVTSMTDIFYGCSALEALDLSNFDVSKILSMDYMFKDCSSLKNLDLSGFVTSKLVSTGNMFYGCSSLSDLDLSGFDTSKVTNMNSMFNGCSALKTLDLSSFDTSKATGRMVDMFAGCSLDVVRCRPMQFSRPAVPTADKAPASFLIPSSSGSWYDFKGAEVADFTSDDATSLYSDPSKAPDGSKLVNLQDLKAALETMGGSPSGGLPLIEDTVIAEIGGKPVWGYVADANGDGAPGFVGRIAQGESWIEATFGCIGLGIEVSRHSDAGQKNMSISMTMDFDGPVIKFGDEGLRGVLAYRNGMPVLTAMGETGPIMAGNHPYGFATYASDEDFMDYITQVQ